MPKVEERLRALGSERAPAGFAERVIGAALGDAYAPVDTVIGRFWVAWNGSRISAVQLMQEAEFVAWFERETRRPLRRVESVPDRVRERVLEMRGRDLVYDLSSISPFERAVLMKTLEIPRGEVRTYSWVAREIGAPRAVRAVGTALANNPIPLLIPCHRVVRSDGVIGNYGAGGPVAKKRLLALEGVRVEELEQLARRRTRFIGSDTTHVFCVPTCRDARRVTDRHRVEFRTEAEAEAAGYRPCRHCRPVAAA
ncbi:MAG TPA: methylated-DNA--[protein]-cysteine S-methyltransferase [Candidatus Dormibacteraeota bacterium]